MSICQKRVASVSYRRGVALNPCANKLLHSWSLGGSVRGLVPIARTAKLPVYIITSLPNKEAKIQECLPHDLLS